MERREAPREFVRDSGAAELSEGVVRIWSARMDDGKGAWHVVERFGRVVVIGDDEVHAEFFGGLCGLDRSDSAIDGDDDLGAVVCKGLDGFAVEAVAFLDTVGDVGGDFGVG